MSKYTNLAEFPLVLEGHSWPWLTYPSRWRHNERDGVSNHQPYDSLLNRLFWRRSKKTSKLRVTGICEGNSPVTGEFPAQRASNAEDVSIWWRHHAGAGGHAPNFWWPLTPCLLDHSVTASLPPQTDIELPLTLTCRKKTQTIRNDNSPDMQDFYTKKNSRSCSLNYSWQFEGGDGVGIRQSMTKSFFHALPNPQPHPQPQAREARNEMPNQIWDQSDQGFVCKCTENARLTRGQETATIKWKAAKVNQVWGVP